MKGEINSNIITARHFNTPLSTMGRSSRLIIKREALILNYTIDQKNLTDIYITFYPTTAEYILLKHTWNISQGISYVRPRNGS